MEEDKNRETSQSCLGQRMPRKRKKKKGKHWTAVETRMLVRKGLQRGAGGWVVEVGSPRLPPSVVSL